jgi:HD-GYP domain-containing protein (c-di-GMP phosphodiesterase class II)/HAMP domain-containing protein
VPFRVTLITFTAALSLLIAGSILAVVYVQGQRAADRQAAQTFELAASTVEQRLTALVAGASDVVDIGASQSLVSNGSAELEAGASTELIALLDALLATDPALYSVYFGAADGRFVQLVGVDDELREQLGAPADAATMVREVFDTGGDRVDRRRFLDLDGEPVGQPVDLDGTYDPRTRPWFEAAGAANAVVVTAPYVFDSTGAPGVTLARAATSGDGVFGADLTLTELQRFVADVEVSQHSSVYLFDDAGELWVASRSDGAELDVGPIAATGDESLSGLADVAASGTVGVSEDGDQLAHVSSWSSPAGRTVFVGITAPRSDFTGFVDEAAKRVAIILPIVVLFGLVAIWLVARSISRPLRRLSDRADRVAGFAFDDTEPDSSFIAEIDSLNRSFATMTDSLRDYIHALAASHLRLETLIDTGIALTAERDPDRLFARVLDDARSLTHARAGVLLDVESDGSWRATHTSTADGTDGVDLDAAMPTGQPTTRELVDRAISRLAVQNSTDVEVCADDEFTGDDAGRVVRSRLVVPVLNRGGGVDAILVLADATDPVSGDVVAFSRELEGFVTVAASQAAAALDSAELLAQQRRLIEAIIELIAGAIDAKSPYTAEHCNRVPRLALWLADAASECADRPFDTFALDEEERYEFRIAAWLHDCGKVTTPEYVVDKATKLETIYNRIHEVRTRFEVLLRDARIAALEARLDGESREVAEARYETAKAALVADFEFVAAANVGGEFMGDEERSRIRAIAQRTWTRHFDDRVGLSPVEEHLRAGVPPEPVPAVEHVLADQPWHKVPRTDGGNPWGDNPYGYTMTVPDWEYDHGEITNLGISRGTLTDEERFKINDHMIQTINMLEQLPLPATLARVPEIAGGHHETMVGTGYPKGLTRDEMSLGARIIAIADIFEALTAADRPYKPAKTVSESLAIMQSMRDNDHIDPDLFELFLRSGIVERYAAEFLLDEQCDVEDLAAFSSASA